MWCTLQGHRPAMSCLSLGCGHGCYEVLRCTMCTAYNTLENCILSLGQWCVCQIWALCSICTICAFSLMCLSMHLCIYVCVYLCMWIYVCMCVYEWILISPNIICATTTTPHLTQLILMRRHVIWNYEAVVNYEETYDIIALLAYIHVSCVCAIFISRSECTATCIVDTLMPANVIHNKYISLIV